MAALNIPGVKFVNPKSEVNHSYGIYGHFNTGKTHLMADAAMYYMDKGMSVIYVITPEEDPMATLEKFDLGQIAVQVEDGKEFESLMGKIKGKVDVCILDSIKGMNRMAMDKAIGKDRYPAESKDWGPAHDAFSSLAGVWKRATPISIFVCPADRSSDSFTNPNQKTPNLITCDLPGKMAAGIQGLVSHIGYLTAERNSKTGQREREVTFVPEKHLLSCARSLTREMTESIKLDLGKEGNWAKIMEAFDEHRG